MENPEKQRSHAIGEYEVSWRCGRYGANHAKVYFLLLIQLVAKRRETRKYRERGIGGHNERIEKWEEIFEEEKKRRVQKLYRKKKKKQYLRRHMEGKPNGKDKRNRTEKSERM